MEASNGLISDDNLAVTLKEQGATNEQIEKILRLKPFEDQIISSYSLSKLDGIEVILLNALNPVTSRDENVNCLLTEQHALLNQPNNGWDRYVKNLTVYEFNADHGSIMTGEHLPRVAKIITDDIRKKNDKPK